METVKDLPPSDDKETWDGEVKHIDIKDAKTYGVAKEGHRWVQQGPYLVCKSCPLKHSVYIGMNKRLTGFKEGIPVLEKVVG